MPSYTIKNVFDRTSAASSSVTVTDTGPALVTSSWYPATVWLTDVMPVAASSSCTPVTVTVWP